MALISPVSDPRVFSGEVHCWCVSLDVPPDVSARLYTTLAADERKRSARFQFDRDRRRFVVARGVLRELLGRYLRVEPGEIRFVYNAFGKPDLSDEFNSRIRFNLSHSAGLALVAVADGGSIGVDVEYIRDEPDYPELARHFFSAAEIDSLMAVPGPLRPQGFFDRWTKKEACVKACGDGLAIPLNGFSVPASGGASHAPVELCFRCNEAAAARYWSLFTLQPAPGYAGALAIEGSGWRLSQRQWKPRGE